MAIFEFHQTFSRTEKAKIEIEVEEPGYQLTRFGEFGYVYLPSTEEDLRPRIRVWGQLRDGALDGELEVPLTPIIGERYGEARCRVSPITVMLAKRVYHPDLNDIRSRVLRINFLSERR